MKTKTTKTMSEEFLEQARASGRRGSVARWGADHGPTKSVRAFAATVDRFRAAIPAERDRASAATAALDAYLDTNHKTAETSKGPPITVSASLAFKWYDEIEAGRKRIEYRDITPYWTDRLWANGVTERIEAIRFTRGYTNVSMTWEVTEINRNEEDGVYEIHLGKRIS